MRGKRGVTLTGYVAYNIRTDPLQKLQLLSYIKIQKEAPCIAFIVPFMMPQQNLFTFIFIW